MSNLTAKQHRGDRYALAKTEGIVLTLIIGLAIFSLSACVAFTPRPDLRTSTLTLPTDGSCAHGHKVRQVGTVGAYGTPIVEVENKPSEGRRQEKASQ
jgi:hypothetical protein